MNTHTQSAWMTSLYALVDGYDDWVDSRLFPAPDVGYLFIHREADVWSVAPILLTGGTCSTDLLNFWTFCSTYSLVMVLQPVVLIMSEILRFKGKRDFLSISAEARGRGER
jgi:hypothetical protein